MDTSGETRLFNQGAHEREQRSKPDRVLGEHGVTEPISTEPISTESLSSAERISSEGILSSARWRSQAVTATHDALESEPRLTLAERLRRAIRAPFLAAAGVFVFAIIITIAVTVMTSQGGPVQAEEPAETDTSVPFSESTAEEGGVDDETELATGGPNVRIPPEGAVYVHVVGEVSEPGVIELPQGSRIADAIEAAGGATDAAILEQVNLARVLIDGEQILVPDQEAVDAGAIAESGSPGPAGDARTDGASASEGGLVNLNHADSAQLQTLPRIGPALAERIIEWREREGGFTSVEDLTSVSGIGEKTLTALRELVTV